MSDLAAIVMLAIPSLLFLRWLFGSDRAYQDQRAADWQERKEIRAGRASRPAQEYTPCPDGLCIAARSRTPPTGRNAQTAQAAPAHHHKHRTPAISTRRVEVPDETPIEVPNWPVRKEHQERGG